MSDMVIYGSPYSTFVRAARMACVEKGVAHRLQAEGHDNPEALKTPGHLAVHPFGKIPAAAHGEAVLYETQAIIRYVDEAFDGPPLQPAEPLARARMQQWMSVACDYYYKNCMADFVGQYVFPRGADGGPDRGVIDAALDGIRSKLAILDEAYGGGDFLIGAAPKLADLLITPILFASRAMPEGEDLFSGRANVLHAMEVMGARPSFAETEPPAKKTADAAELGAASHGGDPEASQAPRAVASSARSATSRSGLRPSSSRTAPERLTQTVGNP